MNLENLVLAADVSIKFFEAFRFVPPKSPLQKCVVVERHEADVFILRNRQGDVACESSVVGQSPGLRTPTAALPSNRLKVETQANQFAGDAWIRNPSPQSLQLLLQILLWIADYRPECDC
jgi:hypothetical protein